MKNQAIIINVGTKKVSTLALLSALKYAKIPVTIINCEINGSNDLSHFKELQKEYNFELLDWPLQSHGKTLDRIFTEFTAENILCIDSDLEIIDPKIIDFCFEHIDKKDVFGTGFIQMAEWDIQPTLGYKNLGYSTERPYMPLVLLKRHYFADAIKKGMSFDIIDIYNDSTNTFQKKWLLKTLNKLIQPVLINTDQFKLFDLFFSDKKYYIKYDTGALIHNYLRFEHRLEFVGLPHRLQDYYVKHYHGVTRYLLNPKDSFFTTDMQSIIGTIEANLKDKYNTVVN